MVVSTIEALAVGIPALIALIFLGTATLIYIVTRVSYAMARAMAKLVILGDPTATKLYLHVQKDMREEERLWETLERRLKEVEQNEEGI